MPSRTRTTSAGASRVVITLTACIVALILFGVLTFRYVTVDLPAEVLRRSTAHTIEVAHQIAGEISRSLQVQPKVTVGDKTIVEQETEVAQLVVLEHTVVQRHRFEHSWLQSKKKFEVEGRFLVRAGFDFDNPFEIALDDSGHDLQVTLPEAEILGAELQDLDILRDEDGYWNKLTAQDRERAIVQLRTKALEEARAAGVAGRAREIAEENLQELLATSDRTVTIQPSPRP